MKKQLLTFSFIEIPLSWMFVFVFLFSGERLYSQISSDLRPEIKSPEASTFERYTDMSVNMTAGAPDEGNWYANAASSLDLDGYYQDYGLDQISK